MLWASKNLWPYLYFIVLQAVITTSALFGKGKKIAWEAWDYYTEVTRAFTYIALNPYTKLDTDSQYFHRLERFTVILNNKTSNLACVNEARMELFCQRNRPVESIPPTKDALLQHLNRVTYQAGIWTTSELTEQNRPSPESSGWKRDDRAISIYF